MGKKVSTKRNKHRAKKAYDSSKDQITWNMLKKMNTTMVEMLASYVEVVNSLSLKYKDKVKTDLVLKESVNGFFKLVKEHIDQIEKLADMHSVTKDDTREFKAGICKSVEEMQEVATIAMEYMTEQNLLTELGSKVVPELAVQFKADEEIKEAILDMGSSVAQAEDDASKVIVESLKDANLPTMEGINGTTEQ